MDTAWHADFRKLARRSLIAVARECHSRDKYDRYSRLLCHSAHLDVAARNLLQCSKMGEDPKDKTVRFFLAKIDIWLKEWTENPIEDADVMAFATILQEIK